MIYKDRDSEDHRDTGPRAEAGARAEKDMAHFLKRAFQNDQEVWVFNDLRYQTDEGDAAQIDHLVLHRSGFIIIESKSVTTRVRINEHREWERNWKGWSGMPSPIKQAERQCEFLREALQASRENLRVKVLGQQMGFNNMPMEVLVAVSTSGIIERGTDVPEVMKADQICDAINAIIERHKQARSIFSPKQLNLKTTDGLFNLKPAEMDAITAWLLEYHYPREQASQKPPPLPEEPASNQLPESTPTPVPTKRLGACTKCGQQGSITYGRYGYYWKCVACDNNTAIKEFCPTCETKMRIRKAGEVYYLRCVDCDTESEYWCKLPTK